MAGITLLILGGMLKNGFILTLDMVWTDTLSREWSNDGFNNTIPLYLLFTSLGLLFPSWIVQKIVLFGLFFSLLYLPYRFLPFIESKTGRLFASLIFTFNPFVYTRFLAGQLGVLLGYACLPIIIYSLNRLIEKRDLNSGIRFGLALSLIGAVSIHFLFLSLLLSTFWVIAHIIKYWFKESKIQASEILKNFFLGLILFTSISTYWLVPALTRETPVETRFDEVHFTSFSASENHLISTPLNLAVLGGFWGEGTEWRYYFLWPQDSNLFWIASFFIFILITFGFLTLWRDKTKRFVAVLLLLVGIISSWAGLRDSQKIAGVLALVYAIFCGVAIDKLLNLGRKKYSLVLGLIPILFVLPLIFGLYEVFGFRGQLTPVTYPNSWYEARSITNSMSPSEKILTLPWQGYFSLPFNNQLLTGNPTSRFFGKDKTIASRTIGMENIYDQEIDVEYREIDTFLQEVDKKTPEQITNFLQSHQIRYLLVIVNKNVEDQNTWLITSSTNITTNSTTDPEKSQLITSLLQSPNEKIINSDTILYRFTY